MKNLQSSYTSMSVKNLDGAKQFYTETVGLEVAIDGSPNMVMLDTGAGTRCMIYPKDDHVPATHTVLNLAVEDIESVVKDLASNRVEFNKSDDGNENGIEIHGPAKMAWFNDPDGNFVSVTENI